MSEFVLCWPLWQMSPLSVCPGYCGWWVVWRVYWPVAMTLQISTLTDSIVQNVWCSLWNQQGAVVSSLQSFTLNKLLFIIWTFSPCLQRMLQPSRPRWSQSVSPRLNLSAPAVMQPQTQVHPTSSTTVGHQFLFHLISDGDVSSDYDVVLVHLMTWLGVGTVMITVHCCTLIGASVFF